MSYLVTVCDTCQAVALTAATRFHDQLGACRSCGQALRVVPTRVFVESERSLFRELSAAVGAGHLRPLEASTLSRIVTRALADKSYVTCWSELTFRLPALISWEQVLGSSASAHEKALRVLKTIFDAVGTTRGPGLVPALPRVTQQLAPTRKAAT